jgi:4-amino-4-deoxy-L-arabinose transferase-like glycosyltransferase
MIRIRLLSIPLERDEGEFAYMGQLILQGIPPYLISYNMKLPGIYAAYALIMFVFGQSVGGIHLGFLVINVATIILVFLLGKRLYDSYTGIIASASFAILSVSPCLLGTSAHGTHFVLLPALGGIIIMLKAIDSGKFRHLFWSGILLGISLLMKQPGVFFIIFAFLYFLFSLYRGHDISYRFLLIQGSLFLLGAIIPFVTAIGILYKAGVLEKFWFWTYLYAKEYTLRIPFSQGPQIFLIQIPHIIDQFYLLWAIGGIGISALLFALGDWRYRHQCSFMG